MSICHYCKDKGFCFMNIKDCPSFKPNEKTNDKTPHKTSKEVLREQCEKEIKFGFMRV